MGLSKLPLGLLMVILGVSAEFDTCPKALLLLVLRVNKKHNASTFHNGSLKSFS
jgi:hypothetical protein